MSVTLDLYRNLILLMMNSRRCMSGLCAPFEITPVQGMLLIILEPENPKSMNELSERMCCDASNITGLIEKLEYSGYVERTPSDTDRRVKMICLTDKGIKCRNQLLEGLKTGESLDFDTLNDSEKSQLADLLEKLVA